MQQLRLQPNVITYTLVISACQESKKMYYLQLLMTCGSGDSSTLITYGSVISAYGKVHGGYDLAVDGTGYRSEPTYSNQMPRLVFGRSVWAPGGSVHGL